MNTPSNRLVYKVYTWDRKLSLINGLNTWSTEIKSILNDNNLGYIFDNQHIFPVKPIIDQLKTSMHKTQQQIFRTECQNKPKLRTFMLFKEFETLPPHIGKPLSFVERKTISKLRLGILPIRLETACYVRPILPVNFSQLSEEERLKIVLNKPENVKHTAQYLISIMDLRSQVNNVY